MKKPSMIGMLLIAALLLSLCLSACSGNNTAATETAPAATEAAATEAATAAPTEAEEPEAPTLEEPLDSEGAMYKVLEMNGLTTKDCTNITMRDIDDSHKQIDYNYNGKSYSYKVNIYTGVVTQIGDAVEEADQDFHKADTAIMKSLSKDEDTVEDMTYDRVEQDGKTLVKVVFNTNIKHHEVLYDPESDTILSDETSDLS